MDGGGSSRLTGVKHGRTEAGSGSTGGGWGRVGGDVSRGSQVHGAGDSQETRGQAWRARMVCAQSRLGKGLMGAVVGLTGLRELRLCNCRLGALASVTLVRGLGALRALSVLGLVRADLPREGVELLLSAARALPTLATVEVEATAEHARQLQCEPMAVKFWEAVKGLPALQVPLSAVHAWSAVLMLDWRLTTVGWLRIGTPDAHGHTRASL